MWTIRKNYRFSLYALYRTHISHSSRLRTFGSVKTRNNGILHNPHFSPSSVGFHLLFALLLPGANYARLLQKKQVLSLCPGYLEVPLEREEACWHHKMLTSHWWDCWSSPWLNTRGSYNGGTPTSIGNLEMNVNSIEQCYCFPKLIYHRRYVQNVFNSVFNTSFA